MSDLKTKVELLPDKPGVYQFFNKEDKIIYVGKAVNLKKRVSSYFQKKHDPGKTRLMVSKIRDLKFIVVGSETDALLLENNLIKKYQPRYNILLKDDKSFPWIVIKNEPFPRIMFTRNIVKDGSHYYGPYTSLKTVRTLLDLAKKLYPLRTCTLNLNEDKINEGLYKVCLEYHIGNCKGPCVKEQSSREYLDNIESIKKILKGDINQVLDYLKNLMKGFANDFRFEEAQDIKERIEILETFQSKSTIVNPSINNVDVFTIIEDENYAYVNYLKIINGSVMQVHSAELRKVFEEPKEELLTYAILDIWEKLQSTSLEVYLPFKISLNLAGIKITVPKIGDKKKLLELSERNARYYKKEIVLNRQKADRTAQRNARIMETMKKDLQLEKAPVHIECFDNSNIQGTNPVAACVVFKNARPSNKEYRHYHIKTVEGPDDFASMEEVVYRRYSRLLKEEAALPDLVVIDGGKGQLGSAVKIFQELGIMNRVPVIGIAKRLEEIYKPGDSIPLYIDKNSETLKVIQHIRNEAHRFGITFHRDRRSANFMHSELDGIKGVGEKLKKKLLETFKTVDAVKLANQTALQDCIGINKGKLVYDHFNSK